MKRLFYVGALSSLLLAACGDTTNTESSTKDDAAVTEDVAEKKVEEPKGNIEAGTYGYHNLQTSEKIDEVGATLKEKGVSEESWNSLVEHINLYNSQNNIKEQLASDWSTHLLSQHTYKFSVQHTSEESAQAYRKTVESIEKNLNCRKVAFILIRDMIQANDSIDQLNIDTHAEATELKQYYDLTQKEEKIYSLLFNNQENTKSIDKIIEQWKAQGIVFSENIKLVTAWSNSDNNFIQLHAAVAYEDAGKVVVVEKVDPDLPYQISKFNSWSEFNDHWKNGRLAIFENTEILVNDDNITAL